MLAKIARDPRPTTDSRSERCLAAAMGYPKTWRVVRISVPMSDNNKTKIEDRIYAGNPERSVDTWFNHDAARTAALLWVEGESTAYSQKGGQLLPMMANFDKNDIVQVFYEPEDTWYDATILKRVQYDDAYRYMVHYTEEDSKQSNIMEACIRAPPPSSMKKRKMGSSHQQDVGDEAANAQSLGLPAGWTAKPKANSRWEICDAEGNRYRSKKAALDHVKLQEQQEEIEGDPPWRKTSHKYIGKRVRWSHKVKYSGRREVDIVQIGTVVGWIADSDMDKVRKGAVYCVRVCDLYRFLMSSTRNSLYLIFLHVHCFRDGTEWRRWFSFGQDRRSS